MLPPDDLLAELASLRDGVHRDLDHLQALHQELLRQQRRSLALSTRPPRRLRSTAQRALRDRDRRRSATKPSTPPTTTESNKAQGGDEQSDASRPVSPKISSSTTIAVLPARPSPQVVAARAELVELSEILFTRVITSVCLLLGVASISALVLRFFTDHPGQQAPALAPSLAAGFLVATAVVMCWRTSANRLLLRRPSLQLALFLCAAVLVADPRSELWWPAAAVLVLLGLTASARRTVIFSLVVVLVSAGAQLRSDGLRTALGVPNLTMWISLLVLPVAFAVVADRLVSFVFASVGVTPSKTSAKPDVVDAESRAVQDDPDPSGRARQNDAS